MSRQVPLEGRHARADVRPASEGHRITTALNDERAPAWHALKLTATLQAAQSCPRPVLLRAHDAGGHLGNRGPGAWVDEQAEQLAFVARRLGMVRSSED
ncbi:MAG TPA: prolyl oligopeptidase family serine peptidase [Longimicrobiales bacterium]|nr:prolyl oligopeptidase family serine peptidase [Longimicrobiales bacterium]